MKLHLALVVVTACSSAPPSVSTVNTAAPAPFADDIRRAAVEYQQWGRVDAKPNIAPTLCRAPLPNDHGARAAVRMSTAVDAPHQDKLYYLWASDKAAYLTANAEIPLGFTIVKESFAAMPLAPDAPAPPPPVSTVSPAAELAPITELRSNSGARFGIGTRSDLFVMQKVGDRADADHGWIYGTVSIDGTVTSSGRVDRCMTCHEDATRERLFGLAIAP
ncbi:MAG: hypothetical protein AB7O24_27575 [Kofleriaceae bacterium]